MLGLGSVKDRSEEDNDMEIIMETSTELYDRLAELLDYPSDSWEEIAANSSTVLTTEGLGEGVDLTTAFAALTQLGREERRELFVSTFELNPAATLEIGSHLFGESYKRGEFLARLRKQESDYDIGQEHQLPDYLPVVLRLLGRLERDELREALIELCLLPALETIITPLSDLASPYAPVLDALRAILRNDLVRHREEAIPETNGRIYHA